MFKFERVTVLTVVIFHLNFILVNTFLLAIVAYFILDWVRILLNVDGDLETIDRLFRLIFVKSILDDFRMLLNYFRVLVDDL